MPRHYLGNEEVGRNRMDRTAKLSSSQLNLDMISH